MSESTNQPTPSAQPIDLSAGLVAAESQPTPSNAPAASPAQPTSAQPIDLSAGLVADGETPQAEHDPGARFSVPGVGTVSAIKPPAHIGEALEQWANNVANDLKYGTDVTGVGTVLKKMGAHGVYAGNPEAVGDFMASLPLGAIKALQGVGKLAQGKIIAGGKDIASGTTQAATMPAAFVAPEESVLSKEGLANDAINAASKSVDAIKQMAETHPVAWKAVKGLIGLEALKHRGDLGKLLSHLP